MRVAHERIPEDMENTYSRRQGSTSMADLQIPELMTKAEYVAAQTELDRVAGLECANSLHRIGELEAGHLRHVRNAVWNGRNIHIDNWSDYRGIIPELAGYTFNGNLAVLDRFKGTVWDRATAYRQAVADSERMEQRRIRRELERKAANDRTHQQ